MRKKEKGGIRRGKEGGERDMGRGMERKES